MEKKLTAQGPNDRKSYTVTLPIEWIKKEGLDKSKSVDLEVVGNKIIIHATKAKDDRILINLDDYKESILKVIQGVYRAGINEIKLTFKDSRQLESILDLIEKRLVGYEVLEQKDNYLIIKDITKESEEDFKAIFRRIFLMLLELSNTKDSKQIKTLDRSIKKLINYCQRILVKKGHAEFTKIPFYYLILDRLEKISDEFVWFLESNPTKKDEQTFKEVNDLLRTAYDLFYKFDSKTYTKNQYRTFQLKNEIRLKENMSQSTMHLHNLARTLNSTYADIFTLRFEENHHR